MIERGLEPERLRRERRVIHSVVMKMSRPSRMRPTARPNALCLLLVAVVEDVGFGSEELEAVD